MNIYNVKFPYTSLNYLLQHGYKYTRIQSVKNALENPHDGPHNWDRIIGDIVLQAIVYRSVLNYVSFLRWRLDNVN